MTKTLLAAAAAIALGGFAGQAFAADAGATQSIAVAGVNFSDRAAVQDFYAKLTRIASAACDSYSANSRVTAQDRLCTDRAVAKAVETLNRPVLTAMHETRANGPQRQFASR